MSRYFALFAAVLATSASAANLRPREYYEAEFFDYIKEHKVDFEFSGKKFIERLQIFADNLDRIERHNKEDSTYKLGRNEFTHMTWQEFAEHFNLNAMPIPASSLRRGDGTFHAHDGVTSNPTSINWVDQKKVTQVKNQGSCGSCWSFSASGALEGAYSVKHNTQWSSAGQPTPSSPASWQGYSEQNLVDCDKTDSNCNGGWMDNAFTWIKNNGGICSEASYPYTSGAAAVVGSCKSCTKVAGVTVTSFTDVAPGSVSSLESAVALKPVAIAVAVNSNFQLYSSGVFTGRCGFDLNHGVLLTGYGTDGGNPYWNVKNSWGNTWGEGGYIRILKSSANLCHVLDAPSYVNVA